MTFHKTTEEEFDRICEEKNIPYLAVVPLYNFISQNFIDKRIIEEIIEEELEKMKKEINTADTSRGEKAIYNQALQDLKHTLLKDNCKHCGNLKSLCICDEWQGRALKDK